MKVDRGWIWRVLLLTSLVATAIRAQDEQNEEELKVLMAEEEEEEEEEVTLVDKDEVDVSGKGGGDENVSFQVSGGQYFRQKLQQKEPGGL